MNTNSFAAHNWKLGRIVTWPRLFFFCDMRKAQVRTFPVASVASVASMAAAFVPLYRYIDPSGSAHRTVHVYEYPELTVRVSARVHGVCIKSS